MARNRRRWVLGEALLRIADGAQDFRFQIGLAADVVDELVRGRVEEHAVDGEVAALRVFLRRGGRDGHGMPAVHVGAVLAEHRDLEKFLALAHADDAERLADEIGHAPGEEVLHFLRRRARGHVPVLGRDAEQVIAHAAAREISGVAGALQAGDNVTRPRVHWLKSGCTSSVSGGGVCVSCR